MPSYNVSSLTNPALSPAANWYRYLEKLSQASYDFLRTDEAEMYNAYANVVGGNRSKNYQSWLKNNQNTYLNQYKAAMWQNPTLQWSSFLKDQTPEKDFSMSSASSRGELPGLFTPTMRMVR